jgi:ferredoxin--NADP+ reductase
MFKIISKTIIPPNIKKLEVEAPEIAKRALPGQFIMLRVRETGERIPLTIAAADAKTGAIAIIFQEMGKTTQLLGKLEAGESIPDILGPLGHPTHIEKLGTVVTVGGGVGVAEVLPVARAFRDAGNKVIGIIGARTKDLVILENEMKSATDELFVTTDDGTYGTKGFVSNALEDIIKKGTKVDLVYAIGPVPMMRVVSELTKKHGIKTLVSLNPIMVDGTGMCGSCRVTVEGKTRFACVEGPEFDGHLVDWNELMSRLATFKDKEKISVDKFHKECMFKIQ